MWEFRSQFHQRFTHAFFVRKLSFGSFSSYFLALAKNSYKKCARLMLMKSTIGVEQDQTNFVFFHF